MWKPIDTLELSEKYIWGDCSKVVLLYVTRGPYSMYEGPVVGFMSKHLRGDGSLNYLYCTVEGVSGYEFENDFRDEDVTHWMPLPEPPQSSGDEQQ